MEFCLGSYRLNIVLRKVHIHMQYSYPKEAGIFQDLQGPEQSLLLKFVVVKILCKLHVYTDSGAVNVYSTHNHVWDGGCGADRREKYMLM